MNINSAKHLISIHELMITAEAPIYQALEKALDCMTLVQNIDAVYNASDSNEASIYAVQDILENYFNKGGELNAHSNG